MPLWGWVNLLLSTPVGSTWHGLSFSLLSLSLAVYMSTTKGSIAETIHTLALAISWNAQQIVIPKKIANKARAIKNIKKLTTKPIEAACSKTTSKLWSIPINRSKL